MGGGARFRVGIALSAIGEGLREAARDGGRASLRCVCLPVSPAGSGHPRRRSITRSNRSTEDERPPLITNQNAEGFVRRDEIRYRVRPAQAESHPISHPIPNS